MTDLSRLQEEVNAQPTVMSGVETLLAGLGKMIADLKTPEQIARLAQQLEQSTAALAWAVQSNAPVPKPVELPPDPPSIQVQHAEQEPKPARVHGHVAHGRGPKKVARPR